MKPVFFFLLAAFFIFACKEDSPDTSGGTPEVEKSVKPHAGMLDPAKYLTAQNPGPWKGNIDVEAHLPKFEISGDKENKIINAYVTLTPTLNPQHYIEAIVLSDHNMKELKKKSFKPGEASNLMASFKLPLSHKSYVYLIAKCNLHDMWVTRVDWN